MQIQEMKTVPYLRSHYVEDDEVTVRFPVRRQKQKPRWLLFAMVLWMFLVMATAVFGVVGFAYFSDLIFPQVMVMDVQVGGMVQDEVTAVLAESWSHQTFTVFADSDEWTVAPAEMGVYLDVKATVAEAYDFGRTVESWQQLGQTKSARVQPTVQWDTAVTEPTLLLLKQQLDQPTVDAYVNIENGHAVAVSAQAGRSLDVPMTLQQWQMMETLPPNGRFPLHIQPIQPAIVDVSELVAQANRLLATTFVVNAYDPINNDTINWALDAAIWGEWLSLQPRTDSLLQFEWVLDEQLASAYFAEQSDLLGNGRFVKADDVIAALNQAIDSEQNNISLRIYHHPRQYIVQAGESLASIGYDYGIPYPWLQQVNPNVSALTVGQAINIPSPDELLPYPVVQNKRIVISINQQMTWVYENDQLIWEWPISTGIASSPTAPGVFQIQTHVDNAYAANWNLWMPNFMGIYRPVPTSDFMNGFHGFPTRDGANLLWTQNLGSPVTYGCILLSNENATTLFEWAEEGVVVEIKP